MTELAPLNPLNTQGIKVVKYNEPRLDIQPERVYNAKMGGASYVNQSLAANSKSDQQITWSIVTPSTTVGVDRQIFIDLEFLTRSTDAAQQGVTPTGFGDKNLDMTGTGYRQFPIHSIIQTCNLRINGQSFSWEPSKQVHELLRYGNTYNERNLWIGASPHQPDSAAVTPFNPAGSRNPYSVYMDSNMEDSRNMRYWSTIVSDVAGNASFSSRFVEPMMLSPLNFGENETQCMFGVQNIEITLNLNDLKNIFCGGINNAGAQSGNFIFNAAAGPVVSTSTVTIVNAYVHVSYVTPQYDQKIPSLLHYPLYQTLKHEQNITPALAANTSSDPIPLNNLQLTQIPKRIYIYAKKTTPTPTDTDWTARITKLSILFDNTAGRLSTLDEFDIWRMCVRNGLQKTFLDWKSFTGSVLCLEFGTDIVMSPLLCSGVRGNFSWQPTITFFNQSANAELFTVYTIVVNEGVMSIDNSTVSYSVGALTQELLEQAPWTKAGMRMVSTNMYGSGFWKDFGTGFKKGFGSVMKIGQQVASLIGLIPDPRAQAVSQALGAVGSIGSKLAGQGRSTGGRKGGKVMRTASLAGRY